jgi:putative inorganic carbon (hco3(-)) transporter
VAPLVSIAATNILFAAALLATLIAYRSLEMPRGLALPLSLFILGTLIAVMLSTGLAAGLAPVKQLVVFATLPLIYTVSRRHQDLAPRLILCWAAVATAAALWSFVQLWNRRQFALEHKLEFYRYYVGQRATGFMSHWMAFGAEQMIVLLVLLGALLFGLIHYRRRVMWAAAAVIAASVGISFVRSVWLGSALGAAYLLAAWRPKLLLLAPVLAALAFVSAPASVRERIVSVYKPHGTVDSNEHRNITRRAGLEMIKASPWIGLGPLAVARDFESYVPADIPRPLPEGFYGHLHNLYLQYAAERGVFTLLAYLWFLGAVVIGVVGSATHPLRHAAIAVIIAVLAEAFFEVNLGDSEVLRMFLTVVGCAYAVSEPKEPAIA